mmetsp:Transcript_54631/g.132668  ORF Transcript_54631/g.132668 Transcript_54631/m.132668 type:complete len:196 (-) Transcript_54631:1612-2199(-)
MKSCLKQDRVTGDDDAPSIEKETKRINFGNLRIQKYPIILGDNPSVSYGPPISIDFQWFQDVEQDIEEYESQRPRRKVTYYNQRRHHGPKWILLMISQVRREEMLERAGYSKEELRTTEREVARVKRRQWISKKWYFHPVRAVFEIPGNLRRRLEYIQIQRRRQKVIREYATTKKEAAARHRRSSSNARHSHSIG